MMASETHAPRLLIISHDVVGERMAGPGIRYYHLARVLAQHVPTTLAIPEGSSTNMTGDSFTVVHYTRGQWTSLAPFVQGAESCLCPSDTASEFPQLAQSPVCLIIDGYDPLLAEWLALNRQAPPEPQMAPWQQRMQALTQQSLVGDFYICASERQRDWWLGLLEANGRINPATFAADPSLRGLVDVVPYGLPTQMPPHTCSVIKGVWAGIAPTDKILLWGGGLWPWLDPITAIRAMAKVWATRQDVKLVFPGTRHPNPQVASAPTQNAAALQAAKTLGLLDQAVFFGDWVPYADWPNVLHESALALTLHYDSLETRLAFRSRVLEYIGAELPMIATKGDATSELIAHYELGSIVEYEDVDGVAAAIQQLLAQPQASMRNRFAQAQAELSWERAAAPLVAFCRQPQRAADKRIQPPVTGNPYYAQFQIERDRLRTVVQGYERGRVMRLLNWLNRRWQRFRK